MEYNSVPQFDAAATAIVLIFAFVVLLVAVVIYWRIFAKTVNSGALSLLMFVPIVNLIMILYLAFSEWPIEQEVKQLRAQANPGGYPRY